MYGTNFDSSHGCKAFFSVHLIVLLFSLYLETDTHRGNTKTALHKAVIASNFDHLCSKVHFIILYNFSDDFEKVEKAINSGVNIGSTDESDRTVFHYAAEGIQNWITKTYGRFFVNLESNFQLVVCQKIVSKPKHCHSS